MSAGLAVFVALVLVAVAGGVFVAFALAEEDKALIALSGLAPLAVVGLAMLAFSSITLIVDHTGVEVRYGPTPFRTRVRAADIRSVSVVDVNPWRWGWGYRMSRRLFKRAAIVVRGGPGVRLEIADGTSLTIVTVDADHVAREIEQLVSPAGESPT
ncbi:MAG: hypothetical protein R3249_06890 [Nitriliruptorales bacterium]|nr:hypothetical protein [Nitriliruptorales bacterium]